MVNSLWVTHKLWPAQSLRLLQSHHPQAPASPHGSVHLVNGGKHICAAEAAAVQGGQVKGSNSPHIRGQAHVLGRMEHVK